MAYLTTLKQFKFFGLTCILLVGTATAAPLPQKELQIAKDYVLAACIGSQYVGTALDNETDAWAAMLVDAGSLPGDAYPKLEKLAKSAPPPLVSQHGVVLRLKRCVDFINSPEINTKISKALAR
jgi:hypothetical protein